MIRRTIIGRAAGIALIATGVAATMSAQTLDRTQRPPVAAASAVTAPTIVKRTLGNGLQVWTVTRRDLPIVNALLVIRAGSGMDGAKPGIAQVTASLLDEGSAGRSAIEFANALDFLGANLNAGAADEQTQVSLLTLRKQADSAFALMGDMVTRPAFAEEELARERRSRVQALRQQTDRPTIIATETFNRLVYGEDHPYGHPSSGTADVVQHLTRDDVTAFYDQYYRPNNAVLVIVGDVTPAEAQALATRAFGRWVAKPVPAAATAIPARPTAQPTAVYLVDKPGAAQSEIRIGHALAPRSTSPDYYALRVLNAALGEAFTSRINLNIREAKGYTYGARTGMTFNRGAGPFVASSGVFTAKTDSSLIEFMKEIREIRAARPITPAEAEFARSSLVRAYPRRLETNAGVAGVLADIAFFKLPDSEITGYLTRIQQVKPEDVTRVAEKYLAPDSSVIVVVGDLAKIQPGIEALHLGKVTVLDATGR
jgi:zinc protease